MTCVDGKWRTGHRGRPRGDGRPPPVFDQQAFIEAMGAMIATTVQVDVARGKAGNEPSYSGSAQARLEKSSARAQLVS